jgi:hypothetical protein
LVNNFSTVVASTKTHAKGEEGRAFVRALALAKADARTQNCANTTGGTRFRASTLRLEGATVASFLQMTPLGEQSVEKKETICFICLLNDYLS